MRRLAPHPRPLTAAEDHDVTYLNTFSFRESIGDIPPWRGPGPREAGASAGGTFRANPVLDLRVAAERQEQVDDWLRQLGLDAGLTGMEALVERYLAAPTA